MRIGLITDTHIPTIEKAVPAEVSEAFKGVDLILHAGDIYSLGVLDDLEQISPVLAALGDDDDYHALKDSRVKQKHIIQADGVKIWLVHEPPYGAFYSASGISSHPDKPDVIVFGHEHNVTNQQRNGILWVNSGSPTFLQYVRGLGTVGIMEVNCGRTSATIVHL